MPPKGNFEKNPKKNKIKEKKKAKSTLSISKRLYPGKKIPLD